MVGSPGGQDGAAAAGSRVSPRRVRAASVTDRAAAMSTYPHPEDPEGRDCDAQQDSALAVGWGFGSADQ